MTRLAEALQAMGLVGEISLAGRWVRFQGERCQVYVAEAASGGYYTWCDDEHARAIEPHLDAAEAIQSGLQRAAEASR